MINELCLIRNTQEVSSLPINGVLRNDHFCINIGAKFSQIIPSQQESLRLPKNINITKTQVNGATNSLDKKFKIDTDTFVVVTNFNISTDIFWYTSEKYNGVIPTKERGLHVH